LVRSASMMGHTVNSRAHDDTHITTQGSVNKSVVTMDPEDIPLYDSSDDELAAKYEKPLMLLLKRAVPSPLPSSSDDSVGLSGLDSNLKEAAKKNETFREEFDEPSISDSEIEDEKWGESSEKSDDTDEEVSNRGDSDDEEEPVLKMKRRKRKEVSNSHWWDSEEESVQKIKKRKTKPQPSNNNLKRVHHFLPKNCPWVCTACGKKDFTARAGFLAHCRCCLSHNMTGRRLTLRPACLQSKREKLSDFNFHVTESIELVEASEIDIETLTNHSNQNRRRMPQVGNVGIRCVHCDGSIVVGALRFPDDLATIPHNMYSMVERHLLASCPKTDERVRQQLRDTKVLTTKQSMTKGRIGLPTYLKLLQTEFGLTDYGKKEGVHFTTEARPTTDTATQDNEMNHAETS
jgi:hypothetical protein